MQDERRSLLKKHWTQLLQLTEVQNFANLLVTKEIFAQTDILNIFGNQDERANKKRFFDELLDKDESHFNDAYDVLVLWLNSTGHAELALNLSTKVIVLPETEEKEDLTSSIETGDPVVDCTTTPLEILVQKAKKFGDTYSRNRTIPYYYSRSKSRGRLLIINNYEFVSVTDGHTYRTGAKVDEDNLRLLFEQMGGWVVETHTNQSADDMRATLKTFSRGKRGEECDICFIIIMSHGSESLNETIVYGTDGHSVSTTTIQTYFTNENCPFFMNKPKVFIYQVCRGTDLDLSCTHRRVEFDGKMCGKQPQQPHPIRHCFRPVDDMLVGYATMQGSKAHRDKFRGTWYIELICKNFMKLAKDEPVDSLLIKVDAGLRKRKSEYGTVQTAEHICRGFKRLYLNPGIYEEDGIMKTYDGKVAQCCVK
ncbi:caspase-2-like [Euwallacea similis]|uniref:caspase-2-like n=1 Tax=Euwallacea similis TaxID=1736056 RepID=UPI00344BAA80